MNTEFNDVSRDDARFDRLVDGELSETERRELLAGLDNEPNGWRRCAGAFLEAQTWRQEFGAIAKNGAPAATTPRATVVRRAPWLGRVGAPLAIAASLLVALWAGAALQRGRGVAPVAPSGAVGDVASTAVSRQLVAGPMAPGATAIGPNAALPSQPAANPWRLVTLSSPSGAQDANMSVEVPAMERNNVDPQWLQSLPSAIPDDVLQAFNRTGHRVQQQRELIPVPLNDGRRMIVPVDKVDIHYTGNKTY
jgi:hypothetical protein